MGTDTGNRTGFTASVIWHAATATVNVRSAFIIKIESPGPGHKEDMVAAFCSIMWSAAHFCWLEL